MYNITDSDDFKSFDLHKTIKGKKMYNIFDFDCIVQISIQG